MTYEQRRFGSGFGLAFAAVLATLLAGCGGGSSGAGTGSNSQATTGGCADCGTLLVGVTDADGDFVSYSVDVQSVTLKRANGATVETLPAATRIDFAQLTDLTDLLSAATIAPGEFVSGAIRLDYSTAEIFVEQAGQIVAAQAVDEDGRPLGVVDLEIQLSNRDHLVITRGRAAFLSLDFDLAASNEVDLTQSPVRVTARPFIVAEVQPVHEKDLRLRGALVSVDPAAGSYKVDVRPWQRRDGAFGTVTVHTTADTSFEIAGIAYTGAPGLAALAQQPAGSLTVAFGTLAVQSHELTASVVHAGDSVGGQLSDAVHGSVVARKGNQLTVKGAFAMRRDRDAAFHRTVLVDVGPDTKVLKAGTTQTLDAGAISVGQSIVAFGAFSDPPATAAQVTPPTLDATAGRVRLDVTALRGSVVSAVAGQVNLALHAIDRLDVEMFDFAGTGATAATDADPTDYEIATGTLPLATLGAGEAAKVLGFVRPFGSAPADFEGRTLVDRRDLPAVLGIGWGTDGTSAPFLSSGSAGLVLDLHNASIGARHTLVVGMRAIDLLDLPASPTIAGADGRTVFALSERGHVELFAAFSDFAAALDLRLAGGEKAQSLTAYGSYDEGAATLVANRIAVQLVSD